jgi:hypothetical protein
MPLSFWWVLTDSPAGLSNECNKLQYTHTRAFSLLPFAVDDAVEVMRTKALKDLGRKRREGQGRGQALS